MFRKGNKMVIAKIKLLVAFFLINMIPSGLMWLASTQHIQNFEYLGGVGIILTTLWYASSAIFSIRAKEVELVKADTYTSYLGLASIFIMVFYIIDLGAGDIYTNITKGIALGNSQLLTIAFFCILYQILDATLNNKLNNISIKNANKKSSSSQLKIKSLEEEIQDLQNEHDDEVDKLKFRISQLEKEVKFSNGELELVKA